MLPLDARGATSLDAFISSPLDVFDLTELFTLTKTETATFSTEMKSLNREDKIVIVQTAIRNPEQPTEVGPFTDEQIYDDFKDLFELMMSFWETNGIKHAFGSVVVGPFHDELERPSGKSLPARCFEVDGQNPTFLSTPASLQEMKDAFAGSTAAGGVGLTGDPSVGFNDIHHQFVPFTNYPEFVGFQPDGTPFAGGFLTGIASGTPLPSQTGNWTFRTSTVDSGQNWMRDFVKHARSIRLNSLGITNTEFEFAQLPAPLSPSGISTTSTSITFDFTTPVAYIRDNDSNVASAFLATSIPDLANAAAQQLSGVPGAATIVGLQANTTYFCQLAYRDISSNGWLLGFNTIEGFKTASFSVTTLP